MTDSKRFFNILTKTFKGHKTIIIFLIKIFTQFQLAWPFYSQVWSFKVKIACVSFSKFYWLNAVRIFNTNTVLYVIWEVERVEENLLLQLILQLIFIWLLTSLCSVTDIIHFRGIVRFKSKKQETGSKGLNKLIIISVTVPF